MENYSESEIHRFCHITKFIYGDNDWMDSTEPTRLKKRVLSVFSGIQLEKECMLVQFVEQSGHQVPWDNPKRFTDIIDR
jgi:pimeloyl-ACP methyl ester carboxylesterase